MNTSFFETNDYFIDEKVNLLKFENDYKVYNKDGNHIGAIKQKLSFTQKTLRLLVGKKMLPFKLEIRDNDDKLLSSINRGWYFFLSKITINDENDEPIGYIKQKFSLKPKFKIYDTSENQLATIFGDWKAWNFTITDSSDNQIGKISKKWAGALKEVFTTADKYHVNIDSEIRDRNTKVVIISSAITIDMVLKENKHN